MPAEKFPTAKLLIRLDEKNKTTKRINELIRINLREFAKSCKNIKGTKANNEE